MEMMKLERDAVLNEVCTLVGRTPKVLKHSACGFRDGIVAVANEDGHRDRHSLEVVPGVGGALSLVFLSLFHLMLMTTYMSRHHHYHPHSQDEDLDAQERSVTLGSENQ